MSSTLSKKCIICGTIFYKKESYSLKYWETKKFCNHKCYGKWRSKTIIGKKHPNYKQEIHNNEMIKCACGCGQLLLKYDKRGRIHKYINNHINNTRIGIPRSDNSKTMKKSWKTGKIKPNLGKLHWNWKGGISGWKNKVRHSIEYLVWRNDVYKRDWFTCQSCGEHCSEKNIIAHHKESFNTILEKNKITNYEDAIKCGELFDIENGIVLCRKCHLILHRELKLNNILCLN